jgi:hypothetical protein
MAITITINGVDQTAKVQDAVLAGGRRLNYHRVAGSPATLSLYTFDNTGGAGGYRPAIDQTVVVADGATTVFSGVVTDIREESLSESGDGWDKGILCALTCADQNGLLLRDTYSKEYADGTTVKQVLQDLITNVLTGRGVTLDGAQVNGPALTGFKFDDAYIDDILNSLQTITGYVWDITPGKVLSMIAPASVSCGFSLTDGGGGIFGGVTVEQGRSEGYANRVTVVAGPAAQLLVTETITGTGALDHWVLTYTPVTGANGFIVSTGVVLEVGVANRTLSEPAGGGFYTWTAATNTLTRTAGVLALGQVAILIYSVQFPISVTVNDAGEQAAHGIYARKEIREDITDKATATALATGLLTLRIASPKTLRITHTKGLSKPGQSVVCTFSERNINATHMITEVMFWNEVNGALTHQVSVVSGSSLQDNWVDYFKRLGGGAGSSSGPSSISGAIIPTVTGMFERDVIANTGLADIVSNLFESSLRSYVNSAGVGAAVQLGRSDTNYGWVIVADADHGATPGAVGKLRFHPTRRGSSIECAMSLAEPDSGGTDDFILLPGVNANLYLGDYAALMSGLGPSDSRIEGILVANSMATSGYFERSRTTRMGAWTDVAFNAANFTGNGSMTWTLQAGDQATYSWTMVGDTMILAIKLGTTTVGGTPSTALRVVIPGGVLAARDVNGAAAAINNSSVVASPIWSVTTGQPYVEFFLDISGGTNWAAATNTTYVQAVATFPAQ